jgi:hypothetical protein
METTTITKQESDGCSRSLVLLFNRVTMYQCGHPQVDQAIDNFHQIVQKLLESVSPLTFIHNHDQFFMDQEPVDPRINTQKVANHFKKTGIQSISFVKDLEKNEIKTFLEIYDAPEKYPDAETMKNKLKARRVQHLKINHVIFIKATEDDELVSRDAIKNMSPELSEEAQTKSKKLFLDMVLESVLSEEVEKTFVIDNLMNNPTELSRNMVEADLDGFSENYAKGVQPGQVLMHQLDIVKQEVERNLSSGDGVDLPMMAAAVTDMEGQLKKEIEARKANDIVYPEETLILDKANEIKDDVLIQIIKNESPAEEISPSHAKQILQDLNVDENDVSRILPKIKTAITDTTFGVGSLLKNPAEFSKKMIQADLADSRNGDAGESRPGHVLLHQLESLKQEVEKNLSAEDDSDLSDVASALFGMKKQLIAEMESQKALKVAYANEDAILGKVNDLTDNVLLQLLKDEYQAGKVSTQRLAQILRRLVPEADELKRLLPKIKTALLGEGMPLAEYIKLVQELGKELQNEELAKILESSAEEIGIDGERLISIIKKDPVQASALISLAAEIQESTGDEKVLSDLLVDYVEQLGADSKLKISKEDMEKGDQHLRQVVTDIESKIVGQFRSMNIKEDIASQLEKRLTDRMDVVFEKVKLDIIQSNTGIVEKDSLAGLSILEILAQNVGDADELGAILNTIQTKAQSGDIDENNFAEIFAQITKEQKRRREGKQDQALKEILDSRTMIAFIKKEILRTKRYHLPFVVLAFSLVSAKPKAKIPADAVSQQHLENAILNRLLTIVRDSDIVGMLGKNKIGILLPHTPEGGGERSLRRCIRMMHSEPIQLNGIPFEIKLAGVHSEFDFAQAPNAKVFVNILLRELTNLEVRLKNIQSIA